MESIEQTFNGQADFGRRVQCTISRNGDLAYRTYLQVTLPEINQSMGSGDGYSGANEVQDAVYARWLDYPGEQLISMVEVEIGGQRIDRQYGDWMHIWNQLTLTAEAERGYNKMVGQTTQLTYVVDPTFANIDTPCAAASVPGQVCVPRDALPETTLYVPLQFWFCRNPGLALPLIALQYHEVKINLELSPIQHMLYAVKKLGGCADSTTDVKAATPYKQSLVAASLYVDYVFLDTDERRRMAQNPHEYLIEQLQFTGSESVGSSSNRIKLNFNHPCKELVWVVQPDANVDYCNQTVCCQSLFKALGAQPFNYTDAIDALPNTIRAFAADGTAGGIAGAVSDNQEFVSGDIFADVQPNIPSAAMMGTNAWGDNYGGGGENSWNALPGGDEIAKKNTDELVDAAGSTVSDAGAFVLAETALNMHCWGENPVVTAKLQLNGQDRFSEREGTYFDLVQPFQHHTRNPDTGINVYSFALRPEEHQPSGTCNMSRIDNASLQLVLSTNAIGGTATAKVRVYATNYNVLRVMSGMGGLAYSN